jgi:lysophospholipase
MKSFIFLLFFPLVVLSCPFQEGLSQIEYYQTPQGHLLRYTRFKTPVECRGAVFFLQGRGTFLEYYEALINPLLERGFDVWMYDLSGQGGSDRLLSGMRHDEETVKYMQHVDSFDLYVVDAIAFIQDIVLPRVEGELILGGYSTGGHVALRVLQNYPDHPFTKAFLFSPLLALNLPLSNGLLSNLFWAASALIDMEQYRPGAGPIDPIFTTPFEQNGYTSDPERYRDMQNLCLQNPHLMMGGASLGWVKSAIDSICLLWAEENIKKIKIPLALFTGGDDTIVDITYNHQFLGKHLFYPTGRHEIFRESVEIHTILWRDFDAFIKDNHDLCQFLKEDSEERQT